MSRRKKHPEHVNHERWLVSYADFITLLFAFFVVLFASSQADKKKQAEVAAAMQTAFSPPAIFELHAKRPSVLDNMGSQSKPAIVPAATPKQETPHELAERLAQRFAELARSGGLPPGSLNVRETREGVVISLQEAGFFPSGSAEVRTASMATLEKIAAALPDGPMRVEGHTDNAPIHNAQFANNWELSSARATTIAQYLLAHGTAKPEEMAVTGYAEYHPVASNATAEGRARNRRVDIILLSRPESLQ